jgi:hypothetical protein
VIATPAIYDPGQFDLSWLLENEENLEDVLSCYYLTINEIDDAISNKNNLD